MSFTAAQIIALRVPAYASDTRLTDLITLAGDQTSSTFFGERYEEALALRVMHWLTLESRDGAGGAVTSIKTGDLGMSFAAGSGDELSSTSFGNELKALINSRSIGARTRMG